MNMEFNLLKIGFSLMTIFVVVMGCLINNIEKYMPVFLTQTFRHGKFAYQGKPSQLKIIEVPKSWFRHFYVFASVYTTLSLILTFGIYFLSWELSPWLVTLLDLLASSNRKANVSAVSSLLALSLLTIQAWRRFYETWFVSVFSNTRMNFSHYIVGFIHYFGSVTAILAESPGFIDDKGLTAIFQLKEITLGNIYGSVLFLWAFCCQYKAAVLLANLRKNKKGSIVTLEHRVPHGDWFELVSSPHNMAEILMYLALTFILFGSNTWPVVFLWVLSNQVETALLTHWWYKSNFKDYPPMRKAVIPYVL
ncbi:polyprenol reductase [Cryptotermes secundus]|uniref:polyprenol reductase n=1 Tax=Cryptotermes secundus TaxID=105785 RepID=UPI000CD7B907|nr:polyprenol reductase [Cryptotermes secundus]